MSIAAWARKRGVKLYHFTDLTNIALIRRHGGFFSWWTLQQLGMGCPAPGGNQTSRRLDLEKGLQDFVRLCFVDMHQMAYVARQAGRMPNPVFLSIDLVALDLPGVRFSNINATDTDAEFGKDLNWFMHNINWDLIVDREADGYTFWNKPPMFGNLKHDWQAEALVPRHLPAQLINNLNAF